MGSTEIANNRQARHLYTVIDSMETGIELSGTEVKSIRNNKVNLKDSFAIIKNNELIIKNMHISPYEFGNINNKEPMRDRKLLLHKKQVYKLIELTKKDGYTLVPLKLYFKERWVKLELGICKGKKLYDKREDMKKKEVIRKLQKEKYM